VSQVFLTGSQSDIIGGLLVVATALLDLLEDGLLVELRAISPSGRFLAARRKRVVPIAAALADLAVLLVHDELGLVPGRQSTALVNGCTFRGVRS